MDDAADFLACLEDCKAKNWREPAEERPPAPPKPPPPKMDLTLAQKRIVVNYVLGGPGKGIFEDIPEFWDGIEDIDEAYGPLRDAVDEYVEGLKEKMLAELGAEVTK